MFNRLRKLMAKPPTQPAPAATSMHPGAAATQTVPVRGFPYSPGVMLHEAIVGSFEVWGAENGVAPSIARNATFGVAKGPKGRALLAQLIAAAGPDVVRAGYLARFKTHAEDLRRGA